MKRYYCTTCHSNKDSEKVVFDAVLQVFCPQCRTALSIIETVRRAPLTLEQSILIVVAGVVGYKVLRELLD